MIHRTAGKDAHSQYSRPRTIPPANLKFQKTRCFFRTGLDGSNEQRRNMPAIDHLQFAAGHENRQQKSGVLGFEQAFELGKMVCMASTSRIICVVLAVTSLTRPRESVFGIRSDLAYLPE